MVRSRDANTDDASSSLTHTPTGNTPIKSYTLGFKSQYRFTPIISFPILNLLKLGCMTLKHDEHTFIKILEDHVTHMYVGFIPIRLW